MGKAEAAFSHVVFNIFQNVDFISFRVFLWFPHQYKMNVRCLQTKPSSVSFALIFWLVMKAKYYFSV